MAHRYARSHFGRVTSHRFVAVIGDAELDEGSVWEVAFDEALQGLGNVLLIVDLNRQSLDRVVPGIRVMVSKRLFQAANWQVVEAKYGRTVAACLRMSRWDGITDDVSTTMSNEEYQKPSYVFIWSRNPKFLVASMLPGPESTDRATDI